MGLGCMEIDLIVSIEGKRQSERKVRKLKIGRSVETLFFLCRFRRSKNLNARGLGAVVEEQKSPLAQSYPHYPPR